MANFNLVVDTSSFKPFSYDEIIKPLLLYKKEEEDRQQAYLEMLEKASTLEALANSTKDVDAYNTYTAYRDRLLAVADDMSRNGLTRKNNQVFDLRRSYMKDIKPLNDLLETRNRLIEEQRSNNKDGTNIYSIDYGDVSLADMRSRGTHTYNTLNGNVIRAMASETFAPLAKLILLSPEYESILGKQYFQTRILEGYTLDLMIAELLGTEAGSKLYQLKQNILSSLNLDGRGFSPEKQALVEQFVNMGAMSALGKTEYGNLSDKSYLNPAQDYALQQQKREDQFMYTYDNKDNITGYNPKYKPPSNGNGKPTPNHPKKSEDIYIGDKEQHVSVDEDPGVPPTSVSSRYDGINGVIFYAIRDFNGNIIGWRAVYPYYGSGGGVSGAGDEVDDVDDADGE